MKSCEEDLLSDPLQQDFCCKYRTQDNRCTDSQPARRPVILITQPETVISSHQICSVIAPIDGPLCLKGAFFRAHKRTILSMKHKLRHCAT